MLTVVGFLIVWQVVTIVGLLRADQLPPVTDVVSSLIVSLGQPTVWLAVGRTILTLVIGFVVTSVLGIILGVLLGLSVPARKSATVVLETFKAVPAIAVLPLAILMLGSTPAMSVFLIFFAAFWPLTIQVIYGVRSIDPTSLDAARSLGTGGVRTFLVVIIPSASPYIVTGLRIAGISALSLTVIGEMVGGAPGLGREILIARNNGLVMLPTMFAYIVIAGVIGVGLLLLLGYLEKKVMFWHESQRSLARPVDLR